MKILHLIHRSWPYHGGAERYVWEHARAALDHGHGSTVVTTDAWDMSWLVSPRGKSLPRGRMVHEGVEIIRFPVVHPPLQNILRGILRRICRGGPDRFYYPNPFVPEMDRWLAGAGGYDLVHANAMPFLIHGGYRYARNHGVPLVTVPHANLGGPAGRITPLEYFAGDQRRILRESALVVAQNAFEASVYTDECHVDPSRVMVHGSGIEPAEWVEADARVARGTLSIPAKARIVLSVTAQCRDKGSFTLLDSCLDLWKKGQDFILVMAGPVMDDFSNYLDSVSPGIPDGKLVITGYVSEELRKDLFAGASVVAAPSRLDAFGIVLLDGWISGTPVIGCNAGGMPDIIENGKDGFLVEFGDREELSLKISELLGNSRMADEMARRGREKTLAEFTWERVTGRFYRELEKRGLCTG